MKPVGTILKNARMQEGLSLEELHAMTKIRIKYLDAIEQNEWGLLPGSTYAHGFIKRYAEAVGLDPEKVHALFRREFALKETQSIIPDGMLNEPLKTPSLVLTIQRILTKLFS